MKDSQLEHIKVTRDRAGRGGQTYESAFNFAYRAAELGINLLEERVSAHAQALADKQQIIDRLHGEVLRLEKMLESTFKQLEKKNG